MFFDIFYKQLGSGLRPQNFLCFQDFWCSKLPNGCLMSTRNTFSGFKINIISDFKTLPIMLFETAESWCIFDLTAILCLLP